jgi:hypothetical protein
MVLIVRSKLWPFVVIVGLIGAAVVMLGWQRRIAERLRGEIATQHAMANERAWLLAEHQRLTAAQVKPEELQRLAVDRKAVTALLGEIEAMKGRAAAVAAAASGGKTPVTSNLRRLSMESGPMPAALWRNAGQATPEAAFETALWAGAGGNVDSLTGLLSFDADARADAEGIFAKLPSALQQELATPERLIALLVAKDVPLGSAEILTQITPADPSAADTKLVANLVDAEGKAKEVRLSLRVQDGSWRFVVSPRAVERYAALLETPLATQ